MCPCRNGYYLLKHMCHTLSLVHTCTTPRNLAFIYLSTKFCANKGSECPRECFQKGSICKVFDTLDVCLFSVALLCSNGDIVCLLKYNITVCYKNIQCWLIYIRFLFGTCYFPHHSIFITFMHRLMCVLEVAGKALAVDNIQCLSHLITQKWGCVAV